MGLYVPFMGQDWGFFVSSIGTTRPTATGMGTSVTPAQNAMGSYAQVLTALSQDVYGLWICINAGTAAGLAKDMLVDIGVDPAGGSSYSVLVQEILCSCSATWNLQGALYWYFPIFIKAGSTVAARAATNNATVGTVRVWCACYGAPRDPRSVKCGSYVKSYGTVLASSSGTAVTEGTTSEGAWTQLGTVAAADRPWYWQMGFGINNAAMAAALYHADLSIGDASNKRIVIQDQPYTMFGSESVSSILSCGFCEAPAPPGTLVYGRLQSSTTVQTGVSMAAYGVCG